VEDSQRAAETARAAAEAERARLVSEAEAERARLAAEVEQLRQAAEAERERLAAVGTAASAAAEGGLRWPARAQRELVLSLADAEDVRSGFTEAAAVLGRRGGWDLVVAWTPDHRGLLRCVASWSAESLRDLEQLTVRSPQAVDNSALGSALYARGPVLTAALAASAGDQRSQAAQDAGVQTTLLLPIREGVARIGLLELMATGAAPPDEELVEGLEVVGLQLGQFAALMRWRSGRR
jgi:hypothetical protein